MRTPALAPAAASLSLCLLTAIAGCGGDGAGAGGPPSFQGAPLLQMLGTRGAVEVSLRTSPQPPVRGMNAAELTVRSPGGVLLDGLTLKVTPWMPDMGHGTSITPQVTAMGGGVYLVEQISLFMAGRWQLRAHLGGAVSDDLWPELQIE